MGKKKKEEMDKQRSRFVSGSVANGIDEEKAVEIFELMAKFAAYGFNKSHSAAYGYISYQTAYLKAHYRPEYMAALMTIEAGNTDKVLQYIVDCRRAGIRVAPVCVNHSERHFSVPPPGEREVDEDGEIIHEIRFGLAAVKNVGSGAIEAILEARKAAGGAFDSAFDFFEEIDYKRANKRVIENLVKAGALDFSGLSRASLCEGLEAACTLGARRQEDAAAGQMGLFGAMTGSRMPDFRFPAVPEWPLSRRLSLEREVLGLYLTGHPMQAHQRDVDRYATAALSDLRDVPESEEVRVMGLVVESRTIRTRRGDKMAFAKLEDASESIECVFFSEAFSRSQAALEASEPILVTGKLEAGEELKILASTAEPLSDIRARTTREVRFQIEVDELLGSRLEAFKAVLVDARGGCKTRLLLRSHGRYEAELTLPAFPVEPSAAMEENVHALFQRGDVVVLS
jgi:DNA polymerase-3 subunit alpha